MMTRRTYGKKIPVVQKAVKLFDEALKKKFCDLEEKDIDSDPDQGLFSEKKTAAGRIREGKTQKENDCNHKGWNLKDEDVNDNTSQHSSFMIFDSKRVEKTKTRKEKAKTKNVPSKRKGRQNAESKNRKVKVNPKVQDNLPLPCPCDDRKSSSITPDLVVEELHKTCRNYPERTQTEGFPDENANFYSGSDRKKLKGKGAQGKIQKKREKPTSEKKKKAMRRISSSHHLNSSVEVARRSKDQTVFSTYALPSSPAIDILKDNERKSFEEDIGDMSIDPKGFENCCDESDSQTGKKAQSTNDASMWITVSSNATLGEEVVPIDRLLQSPEVKMRQHFILNSTAKTAADNIAQLPFPTTLSPITRLAVEFTPHKENQDKRTSPGLPGKKLKTVPFKKQDSVQKCSTKLFTSSIINSQCEEIMDFTRICTTPIGNDPSLLPSHSLKCTKEERKGSLGLLSDDCKNPALSEDEKEMEHKEKLTITSTSISSHLEAQRRTKREHSSHSLDEKNRSQKFNNTTLKGQEVVINDTGKIYTVALTPAAADRKFSPSGKQTVHWCNGTCENKERDSSAGKSSREPISKRSILKRSYETNCNQELAPPQNKYSTYKPLKVCDEKLTHKTVQEMIGDSSICLINRLYMKSYIESNFTI